MTFSSEVRRLGCDVPELKTMSVSPTLAHTCMHGLSDGLACGTISAHATVMFANVMIGSSSQNGKRRSSKTRWPHTLATQQEHLIDPSVQPKAATNESRHATE